MDPVKMLREFLFFEDNEGMAPPDEPEPFNDNIMSTAFESETIGAFITAWEEEQRTAALAEDFPCKAPKFAECHLERPDSWTAQIYNADSAPPTFNLSKTVKEASNYVVVSAGSLKTKWGVLKDEKTNAARLEKIQEPCGICLEPNERPCGPRCGHLFCYDCVSLVLESRMEKLCPYCRGFMDFGNLIEYVVCGVERKKG
ncbi:hypothetical protein TI39_contig426g00017 [Zymoseptoria brevis]|uniref:RING-type domain-containing protein n=1 Tax=Zymoseptoria brevis TaxID=1047168 RepID=A0A0F4GLW3_9PEZI|nr:hypothetical protein TI39_contig426g00017 [Zymoseptoria brevis]